MRWSRGAGTPLGEAHASMPLVQAPTARRLIGFGGLPLSDTRSWTFSLKDDAWSTLLSGSAPPPGRTDHCAVYLPELNQVLLVGGHDDLGAALPRSMLFPIALPAYSAVVGDGPVPTSGCAASYLPSLARAVVVGGSGPTGLSDDTWLFDGSTATYQLTSPPHRPIAASGAGLVYDPGVGPNASTGRLLLFGGLTATGESAALWRFDGQDWGELGTSSDPAATSTDEPRPLGRTRAAVTIDPTRRLLYLFGGARQGGLLGDLWRLDLRSLTWERLALPDAPSGRANASVAFDVVLDRLLLFGGLGEQGPLADSWVLSPG
jgi:hypothetical protein